MTQVIILGMVGALALILVSLLLLRRAEGDPLTARIEQYAAREEAVSYEEIELSLPVTDRLFVPFMRWVGNLVTRFTPDSALERTAQRLEMAGGFKNMTAAVWMALRGIMAVVLAGLMFYFGGVMGLDAGRRYLFTLLFFFVGFMFLDAYLTTRISRRRDAIFKKLPDALDLMTICVDAGLTFDGAMSKVREKWDDPLALEFGRVVYEMQLGKSRRQALRDMTMRMDVPEVASFVASILQADQLGVSVGKVLRIQSEQMRIRRRQRAEEKAQKAPIKMLFPLVFLVFPAMFIVLLGPAVFQVIRSNALRDVFGP